MAEVSAEKKIAVLTKAVLKLKEEKEGFGVERQQLQHELQEAREQVRIISEEYTKKMNEIDSLNNRMRIAQEECEAVKKSQQETKETYEKEKAKEKEQLSKSKGSSFLPSMGLFGKSSTTQGNTTQDTAQLIRNQEEIIQELSEQNSKLQVDLFETKDSLKGASAEAQMLHAELESAIAEGELYRQRVDQLTVELAAVHADMTTLRREIEQLGGGTAQGMVHSGTAMLNGGVVTSCARVCSEIIITDDAHRNGMTGAGGVEKKHSVEAVIQSEYQAAEQRRHDEIPNTNADGSVPLSCTVPTAPSAMSCSWGSLWKHAIVAKQIHHGLLAVLEALLEALNVLPLTIQKSVTIKPMSADSIGLPKSPIVFSQRAAEMQAIAASQLSALKTAYSAIAEEIFVLWTSTYADFTSQAPEQMGCQPQHYFHNHLSKITKAIFSCTVLWHDAATVVWRIMYQLLSTAQHLSSSTMDDVPAHTLTGEVPIAQRSLAMQIVMAAGLTQKLCVELGHCVMVGVSASSLGDTPSLEALENWLLVFGRPNLGMVALTNAVKKVVDVIGHVADAFTKSSSFVTPSCGYATDADLEAVGCTLALCLRELASSWLASTCDNFTIVSPDDAVQNKRTNIDDNVNKRQHPINATVNVNAEGERRTSSDAAEASQLARRIQQLQYQMLAASAPSTVLTDVSIGCRSAIHQATTFDQKICFSLTASSFPSSFISTQLNSHNSNDGTLVLTRTSETKQLKAHRNSGDTNVMVPKAIAHEHAPAPPKMLSRQFDEAEWARWLRTADDQCAMWHGHYLRVLVELDERTATYDALVAEYCRVLDEAHAVKADQQVEVDRLQKHVDMLSEQLADVTASPLTPEDV